MKYRRIEYKGKVYTLQVLAPEASGQELYFRCNDASKGELNLDNQIVISRRVTKRSSLFIDGLRNTCKKEAGASKVAVDPNIRVGFLLDGNENSKDLLKNKKIYLVPFLGQLGFSADW